MSLPYRAFHIDFHTMPKVYDVGANFDAAALAEKLAEAHVEIINFFARDNLGNSYYPTKVGKMHPSLKKDLLGPVIQECHKRGIQVCAYFNAGLHHELAMTRRDWARITEKGEVCTVEGRTGSFFRRNCFNTGYADYVAAEAAEVLEMYPELDGVFFDGLNNKPCFGYECIKGMIETGMDPDDPAECRKFADQVSVKFAQKLRRAVSEDKLCVFNGIPSLLEPGLCSHLELEALPSCPDWGYDYFPVYGRYVENLGRPTMVMTSRFQKTWGDFGGLRPEKALEFDCMQAISSGKGVSIGDHLHPRGDLYQPVFDLVGKVYRKVEKLEPWLREARPYAQEIAILAPVLNSMAMDDKFVSLSGAARMLQEAHLQYTIINQNMNFSRYKLIIMPDIMTVDEELAEKLKDYLKQGGKIISSGISGLNTDENDFALADWGVKYQGRCDFSVGYFKPLVEMNIPDMPISVYETGVTTVPQGTTQTIAEFIKPYFDVHWDGFHGHRYVPPEKNDGVWATNSGKVIHINSPVFRDYAQNALIYHRKFVLHCISEFFPQPQIKMEKLPVYGRTYAVSKNGNIVVSLLAYIPESKGRQDMIEELVPVEPSTVCFKSKQDIKAYLVPDQTPLELTRDGEYQKIEVPAFKGHIHICIENAG